MDEKLTRLLEEALITAIRLKCQFEVGAGVQTLLLFCHIALQPMPYAILLLCSQHILPAPCHNWLGSFAPDDTGV